MTDYQSVHTALEDAIRALRDVVGLDPTRAQPNPSEKVAQRSLERISLLLDQDLTARGHTARPGEDYTYPPLRLQDPDYY